MLPLGGGLKRSASFVISVDEVEVAPVITYKNACEEICEEAEEWEPEVGEEEEDVVEEVILPGVDWESVCYQVSNFQAEDEVTGLAVSSDFIVAQFFLEPELHVFDRNTHKLLHRLEGHEYGGQAIAILGSVLYSGSKDRSLRSWDLATGDELCEARDHRDYILTCVARKVMLDGVGEEESLVVTGGAADHLAVVYKTDDQGALSRRFTLSGHSGWVTCIEVTGSMVITGSQDCTIRLWDVTSGALLQSLPQDAEISCLALFPPFPSHIIFGDGESKMSLLDLAEGSTVHLMPNTLVGTGRYRRSGKYHDKSVNALHVSDNGYIITASLGSKFVKIWKVNTESGIVSKTDVTELQILREHKDYLSVMSVEDDCIVSASGDGSVLLHKFPQGQQHYDMLTTCQERNSVAVLYQGPNAGLADNVESPTLPCLGRACKAGKTGLAKSSSSFEVCFALKPLTHSLTSGCITLPAVQEDSDEDSDCEYVIEYVTDSEEDDDSD